MRLTLDKSWELCLKQWKWIARQVKAGEKRTVEFLKEEWCEENGFGDMPAWCFFCEYNDQHPTIKPECNCPARKIDKTFVCENLEYSYHREPLKFYAKLLELNRKRKKGKAGRPIKG